MQYGSSNYMKIKKSHNFSDYSLNDLEMTFIVQHYFLEVYLLRPSNNILCQILRYRVHLSLH